MSIPIYEYRIYCVTEGKFLTYYGPTPPSTCPNNTADTINPNSIQMVQLIGPNTVVSADASPGDGTFQLSTIQIDIPANPTSSQVINTTVSYPFDMYLWQMSISQIPANIGDQLSLAIAPDTVIGYVTATATTGTNIINVSSTVTANVTRGSEIGLTYTDGNSNVTKEYPGMVTGVDKINGTITVQNNLTHTYLGPVGYVPQTYILLTIYPVKNITFDSSQRLVIGSKGLKTKLVPANTPVKIIYIDNTISTEPLKLYFQLEYYYK